MFRYVPKWNFPSNNYGQVNGIADSGVETFKGTPIKSLAREICQNSLDAILDRKKPVYIKFKTFELPTKEILDYRSLEEAFKRSFDFWASQKSVKAKSFFRNGLSLFKKPTIKCLRISDYNTTGLTGSKEEYNSPWCNLIKSSGTSDKAGSNGGSFGIGKFAPFACSALRTVFYSTLDIEGVEASQGVARLTSFKDKKNTITQGIGFYGNDKNTPLREQLFLDKSFIRRSNRPGTDIYILGFIDDPNWSKKMIASILDGFLYAIYNNQLVVNVDGVSIEKDTLNDLMSIYKEEFKEHADEYYVALTNQEDTRVFVKEIDDDPEYTGKLTLNLVIQPSFSRRVAMVRETGMKIKDKGNISGLIPFAGTLFIEGEAINSFLRGLENPEHLDWQVERADNKSKAKRVLAMMTKFIKASLEEMKNDDSEDAIDPTVGQYLSEYAFEEAEKSERTESIENGIKKIEVQVKDVTMKASGSKADSEDSVINEPGEEAVTDIPGEGGSGSKNSYDNGGNGGGDNPGDGGGNTPIEHLRKKSPIAPISVRSFAKNKSKGEYIVIFTPKFSASDGRIEVFMVAESQNYKANIVGACCEKIENISVQGNVISNLEFHEKEALKITINLEYHDYCSLEVKAYGNKI